MGASACDGHVDAEVALRIADLVDRRLATMQPGERILGDLSVTSNPKNIVTFASHTQPEEISVVDLYSASYDWLVTFRISAGNQVGSKSCRRAQDIGGGSQMDTSLREGPVQLIQQRRPRFLEPH